MSKRLIDWALALLLGAAALGLLLLPADARPEDLELTATARNLAPVGANQQVIEVTVRWRWLRQPSHWGPKPEDAIGIVFDRTRWGAAMPDPWYVSDRPALLGRLGEPQSVYRTAVKPGEEGEMRFTLLAQGETVHHPHVAQVPVRIQYIYTRRGHPQEPEAGWVKAVPGPLVIK